MNDKSVAFIFGYIKNIDYPNKQARKFGLERRFAFALDTYRQDQTDSFFDQTLFEVLLMSILNYIGCDKIVISHKTLGEQVINDVTELHNILFVDPKDNHPVLFENMKIYKKGTLLCLGETSFFVSCGGPYPYHDTYTLSFYVQDFDRMLLQQHLIKCCDSNHIFIRDICTAGPYPQISWLSRLVSFFC